MNNVSLWDVQESSKYGGFAESHRIVSNPKFEEEDRMVNCKLLGDKCKSHEEFQNLMRPYFNN